MQLDKINPQVSTVTPIDREIGVTISWFWLKFPIHRTLFICLGISSLIHALILGGLWNGLCLHEMEALRRTPTKACQGNMITSAIAK